MTFYAEVIVETYIENILDMKNSTDIHYIVTVWVKIHFFGKCV